MMKKLMAWVGGMAMATAAVGCIEEREALPGEPGAWVVGGWVQGDWSEVELRWGTSNEGAHPGAVDRGGDADHR